MSTPLTFTVTMEWARINSRGDELLSLGRTIQGEIWLAGNGVFVGSVLRNNNMERLTGGTKAAVEAAVREQLGAMQ